MINNFKEPILRSLINIVPFSWIKRIGACNLIIVYYHVVSNDMVPHVAHLYKYKSTRQFADDIEFLLKYYTPIGLADVIQWVRNEKILPKNYCFLLTFDDGFREIYDVIAPILLDKGIPATFFICSAFLNNLELCFEQKASLLVEQIRQGLSPGTEQEIKEILKMRSSSLRLSECILEISYQKRGTLDSIAEVLQVDFHKYLNDSQPYLTSGQVKELIDQGFTVGAHSIDHPYYSALSLAEQLDQTIVSVKQIREHFGLNYGAFAFPHNDVGVSHEFFKKLQESGLVDITFGTSGLLDSGLQSHRHRVSLEKPLIPGKEIIAWQYARKLYRQFTGQMKLVHPQSRST